MPDEGKPTEAKQKGMQCENHKKEKKQKLNDPRKLVEVQADESHTVIETIVKESECNNGEYNSFDRRNSSLPIFTCLLQRRLSSSLFVFCFACFLYNEIINGDTARCVKSVSKPNKKESPCAKKATKQTDEESILSEYNRITGCTTDYFIYSIVTSIL